MPNMASKGFAHTCISHFPFGMTYVGFPEAKIRFFFPFYHPISGLPTLQSFGKIHECVMVITSLGLLFIFVVKSIKAIIAVHTVPIE